MLDILLALFIPMGVGYVASRTGILKPSDNEVFSHFVFFISFPCLVLALFGKQDVLKDITPSLLALNIIPFILLVLAFVVLAIAFKLDSKLVSALMLASAFPNGTFVGLPVTQIVFGEEGVKYALLIGPLQLIMTLVFIVPAISLLTKKAHKGYRERFKEVVSNPIIYAIIVGVLLNLAEVRFPLFVEDPIQSIGASTVPVALFALGLFVSGIHVNMKKLKGAVVLSVFRLVPYALLVWLLAPLLGVAGIPMAVSVLIAMMPIAVLSFVISVEYGLDAEAMSLGLMITAILLPVPVYLVSRLI
jgi:predicted permease